MRSLSPAAVCRAVSRSAVVAHCCSVWYPQRQRQKGEGQQHGTVGAQGLLLLLLLFLLLRDTHKHTRTNKYNRAAAAATAAAGEEEDDRTDRPTARSFV